MESVNPGRLPDIIMRDRQRLHEMQVCFSINLRAPKSCRPADIQANRRDDPHMQDNVGDSQSTKPDLHERRRLRIMETA